jgi:hypothetical protein
MKVLFYLVVIFYIFYTSNIFAKDCGVEIQDVAWTSSIRRDKEPSNRYENGSAVPQTKISLWTNITGNQSSLKCLKEEEKLPIEHNWYCEVNNSFLDDIKSLTETDKIELSVGNVAKKDSLQIEVDNKGDGSFDWRTWSTKENIKGFINCRVLIQYRNGDCVKNKDTTKSDCNTNPYKIEFSN